MSLQYYRALMNQAGYSPDAQAVIDRMTSPSVTFQDAIADLVDALVASGDWTKVKEFFMFKGADTETNAYIGWIDKTSTAGGVESPLWASASGFDDFRSGSFYHLDSGYNPVTEGDSITDFGYTLGHGNDIDSGFSTVDYFTDGNASSTSSLRTLLRYNYANSSSYSMTSSIGGKNLALNPSRPNDDDFQTVIQNSTNIEFYYNTTLETSTTDGGSAFYNGNLFIGNANIGGAAYTQPYPSNRTCYILHDADISLSNLQTSINQFWTDMGV